MTFSAFDHYLITTTRLYPTVTSRKCFTFRSAKNWSHQPWYDLFAKNRYRYLVHTNVLALSVVPHLSHLSVHSRYLNHLQFFTFPQDVPLLHHNERLAYYSRRQSPTVRNFGKTHYTTRPLAQWNLSLAHLQSYKTLEKCENK